MGDLSELYEKLNRIEQMLARIDERTLRADESHTDHETRIRALESHRDKAMGFIAAASSVGGIIGATLTWIVRHLFFAGG